MGKRDRQFGNGHWPRARVKPAASPPATAEENQSYYRGLFNLVPDSVFVFDAKTLRLVDCNQAACKLYGYTREELLSLTPIDLHPEDEKPLARRRLEEKRWSGVREYHHLTKKGRLLTVEIRTEDIMHRGRAAHLSLVRDISQRSVEEQKSALHVQQTPLAVIEWNTDFEVTDWNPAAERIFGYSRAEAVGSHASFIVPEDTRSHVDRIWRDLLARKGGTRSTNPNRTRDGRIIVCEWYNTPLIDAAGEVIGVASLVQDVTERVHAEESLQVQKVYLEELFENAPEGIVILDNENRITRANREFTRMFGYTHAECVGNRLDIIVPDDRRQESVFIKNTVERRRKIAFETTRRRKDGTLVDVSILGTPVSVDGGQVAVYLIYRDITDSKRAERALTESESKFRAVAETAATGIFIHDGKRFLYVNKACEQISGFTREELLTMDQFALVNPEFREELRQRTAARLRGERVPARNEFSITSKDGTIRWVDATANQIQFDGSFAVLAAAIDITDRKRSEQLQSALYRIADRTSSAEDLQEFYAAIHSIVGELMYAHNFYVAIYDEQKNILSFPYFVDAEDPVPAPKPLGKGLTEYVLRTGEPQLISPQRFDELARAGEVESIGTPSIDWLGVPVKKGDKAFGALVVQSYTEKQRYGEKEKEILNFVSQHVASAIERKRHQEAMRESEEQLRQSQKMEAVGRLAGGIAHDFNNLLTVIKGYTELMLEGLKPNDPLRPEMEEVERAADRAACLTRALLAFSRRQVLAPKIIDLNQLIRDTENWLRRLVGEDVQFTTVLQAALDSVRADPGQIEQVLMNLAANARDAMPHGGKLTIETANVAFDRDYSREHVTMKPGSYVMLAVSDTGEGMDSETLSHIFEPFFTTKDQGKGTGLGLSTVYGIVKQSGGYIWVDSKLGEGTRFRIYLPRVDAAAEKTGILEKRADAQRGTETILLVEDEEGVRSFVRQVLRRSGYTVLESAHGGEALLMCERNPGPIHLLLTDVVLEHMSGRDLAQRLIPLRPEMQVLYMSGYTDEAILRHGVLTPGSAFVQKPFSPETLARKIREVLDHKK